MAEPFVLTESILTSIKKLLGIDESYEAFDTDIIIHINSALFFANQLGIGPASGFRIADKSKVWSDFVGSRQDLDGVQDYVYLKVKIVWDPPQAGYLVEAIKEQIKELEVRLNWQAENPPTEGGI